MDLTGMGTIQSVTGTAVTGTITNPEIDIINFVSSELGNSVKLSSQDGKLKVNKITSPDLSLEIVNTANELQIEIANSLLEKINNALQPEDISQYTDEQAQDAIGNIVADTTTIDLVYNDITPSISASVKPNSITINELSTEVNSSLNLANTAVQPINIQNFFNKLVDDTDDIVEGTINKFTTIAEKNIWNSKINGIGTVNRIPKYKTVDTIEDGALIQVGGNIGLGSAVVPGELFHIGDGNILLEGGGEVAQKFKRDFTTTGENLGVPTGSGISVNPIFQIGRIIQAGDGDPEIRIMYSDDNTSERTVFEVDRKGIAASVKTGVGSHFEGFASLTDVNPMFRLNSFPRMRLEMGAGGNNITDVAVERGALGELDFFTNSNKVGGFDSLGNFNAVGLATVSPAILGTQVPVLSQINKTQVGLSNVDNTSDTNKPISTATQIALSGKEDIANKQNSLAVDGTGIKYPTVDAVNLDNLKNKPVKYGEIVLPVEFNNAIPAKFYRNQRGEIQTNFSFSKYKGGTKIFTDDSGNDTSGDGSSTNPYKTLTKAIQIATAGAASKYEILVANAYLNRDENIFNQTITNKTIAVISTNLNGTVTSSNNSYVWTLDGTGTYKATRSSVNNSIDFLNVDVYGLPVPLKQVSSLALCQAEKATWYTDGVTVWVHRLDEIIPTQLNTGLNIGVTGIDPILGSGGIVYFENFIFCGWQNGNSLRVQGNGTATAVGEVCVNSCFFVGKKALLSNGDGYRTFNVKDTYIFNCISAYSQRDGFNYSYDGITTRAEREKCTVIEFKCTGYELGLVESGSGSNNVSSAHNGIKILRIGTIGFRNQGATIHDVTGCTSVLYDCNLRTPFSGGIEATGTSFFFSSDGDGTGLGKAFLNNCTATNNTSALTVSSTQTVTIDGFNYTGTINNGGTINYINN
jgi:hypothetical protein